MLRRFVAGLSLCAVLLTLPAGCQNPDRAPCPCREQVLCSSNPVVFPATWQGVWKGTCTASRPNGPDQQFPMELRIQPADTPHRMRWAIVYGTGAQQQVREYEIATINAATGHYQIDEKNSILIDAYLIGGSLHSQYSVENALLTVRYTRDGSNMVFELSSAQLDQSAQSGGHDDVPPVLTYPLQVAQRAVLVRERS